MRKRTIEQLEKEIEKNKDKLLNQRSSQGFDLGTAGLCSKWFQEKLKEETKLSRQARAVANHRLCRELTDELEGFRGCSNGKIQLALKLTEAAWKGQERHRINEKHSKTTLKFLLSNMLVQISSFCSAKYSKWF